MASDYGLFASFYDPLISDVDYAALAARLMERLKELGSVPESILDFGCGTGSLLRELEGCVEERIGVDGSPEMLGFAREKCAPDTLLLCQDMTELDLYGTVDAAVSTLDSLNSLLEEEELEKALSLVRLFLVPGGYFIFDMNTPWKFANVLDRRCYFYDTEEVSCVWENFLEEESGICYFDLTFFIQRPDGGYDRAEESLRERVYSPETVAALARRAGLEIVSVEQPDGTPLTPEAERMVFVTRKPL